MAGNEWLRHRHRQSISDDGAVLGRKTGPSTKTTGNALHPPESSIDPKIVESAEGIFNDAAYFVLLHEYGHALYRHPGNVMVPPAESRANEEAADLFALSVFARRESPPAGVPWF